MYLSRNLKTKKSIKEAITQGAKLRCNPQGLEQDPPSDGTVTVCGPWYPEQPHKWYGQVTLKDGVVISIK